MKSYQLNVEDEKNGENIIKTIKIECAKTDKSIKEYFIEALKEKMERENIKTEKSNK